jgi:hypothetical protein
MGRGAGFFHRAGPGRGRQGGAIIAALKDEFGLGHGHAMAIVALLKDKKSQGG